MRAFGMYGDEKGVGLIENLKRTRERGEEKLISEKEKTKKKFGINDRKSSEER